MHYTTIVLDNFYDDPDSVREFALAQEYNVKGNFPGRRTKSFLTQEAKDKITKALGPLSWNNEDGSTGSFQYTTALENSWIHRDLRQWAGVCYLTPDAPLESGTTLYKDREFSNPKEVYDLTKFQKDITVGNVYNRLILYKGSLLHKSDTYFGLTIKEARLFQVFFLGELNA
jgi:hypothetical protein